MQLHTTSLNTLKSQKHLAKQLLLVACFSVYISGTMSCGKRKPPLPPIERVAQQVDINGKQIGDKINLAWQMPARNAKDGSTLNISRADIYRLAEPLSAPFSLTEEEFAANSTLIASIPIVDSDFGLKQKTYTDTLRFAGQAARLRYAVRFVNASGQRAAFSSFFLIEPTARIAVSPKGLKVDLSQNAVNLEWTAPTVNEDGTSPANILGYNIYRAEENASVPEKQNDAPIDQTRFSDEFFDFEKSYSYFVRTVSLGADGQPIESSSSDTISIFAKDAFPPEAPSAITIAAAPNSISIFFATNLEKDVVGYRVYRSTDPTKLKTSWDLVSDKLLTTNTFQDKKIQSGKTYYYYLTAIDKYGNVSEPSIVISETAF